ncbi:MAG TPA: hypothetical protein VG347_09665 [Verrucomicrobiae bacterium]|nr:hypothetical protein [Verrucomicrobiae bacterium]
MIATFQTLPMTQRMEVALAFVSGNGSPGNGHEHLLKQAFHLRMSKRTIDELESMALAPSLLDLDLDEDRYRELQGADIFGALIRHTEENLRKAEIKKCFLARFEKAFAGKILSARRGGKYYELVETVSGWDLMTRLEFGGEPLNQFHCTFRLGHRQMEGRLRFSIGSLLGLGDLRWNGIRRETLAEDAQMAVQLWGGMRHILMEITQNAESNPTRQT